MLHKQVMLYKFVVLRQVYEIDQEIKRGADLLCIIHSFPKEPYRIHHSQRYDTTIFCL